MAAPLVGALAIAVARAIAAQAAKQGVKKLAATEARQIVRQVAAKQGIKKVSNIEARRIAERAAGPKAKTPTGRVPSKVGGAKTGPVVRITDKKTVVSTPMKRAGKTKTKSEVTKSYQQSRVTPADRRAAMAAERSKRVTELLTPIKPRGVKSSGKTMLGPKTNPRTVQVAKPGPKTERNKLINPADRRLDESRRVGMRDAADRSKTPRQRELEQRPDKNTTDSSSIKYKKDPEVKAQRDADRLVAEGLKKLQKGKKPRPDMPKTGTRAPKYSKRNVAGFKNYTKDN
jgi:hypothetical protein